MKLLYYIKQKWQKVIKGYSDEELWNFDATFCKWVIPRLKAFKEKTIGYPVECNSLEEWKGIIQKMITAFELYNTDQLYNPGFKDFEKENKLIQEGFELFSKHLPSLWW